MKLEIRYSDNYRENTESEKRCYVAPAIESIKLDNEISLILNSFEPMPGDPFGPDCKNNTERNMFESPWA